MTLKEKKFEVEIRKPENKLNMSKCMRKAGYSNATSKAGSKYKQLRKITMRLDFLDPERINKDTEKNRREARRVKAYAVIESIDARRAKMAGQIVDAVKFINTPDEKNELEGIRGRIGLLQPTEN